MKDRTQHDQWGSHVCRDGSVRNYATVLCARRCEGDSSDTLHKVAETLNHLVNSGEIKPLITYTPTSCENQNKTFYDSPEARTERRRLAGGRALEFLTKLEMEGQDSEVFGHECVVCHEPYESTGLKPLPGQQRHKADCELVRILHESNQ